MNGLVSVLLNPGTGRFGSPVSHPACSYVKGVAVGDLNGDGVNDVSVLYNDGHGSFPVQARFATGSRPESLTAADLDADDKLDLVAGGAAQRRDFPCLRRRIPRAASARSFFIGTPTYDRRRSPCSGTACESAPPPTTAITGTTSRGGRARRSCTRSVKRAPSIRARRRSPSGFDHNGSDHVAWPEARSLKPGTRAWCYAWRWSDGPCLVENRGRSGLRSTGAAIRIQSIDSATPSAFQ